MSFTSRETRHFIAQIVKGLYDSRNLVMYFPILTRFQQYPEVLSAFRPVIGHVQIDTASAKRMSKHVLQRVIDEHDLLRILSQCSFEHGLPGREPFNCNHTWSFHQSTDEIERRIKSSPRSRVEDDLDEGMIENHSQPLDDGLGTPQTLLKTQGRKISRSPGNQDR